MNEYKLRVSDDQEIHLFHWKTQVEMKGIIYIIHGAGEHGERYSNFAEYLNSNGYDVFSSDHRGHGKTYNNSKHVHFANKSGSKMVLEDQIEIINHIKSIYKDKPIYLLGHSMGSYITRCLLPIISDQIKGAVISGTGYFDKLTLNGGIFLTKIIILIKGKMYVSKLLNKMSFGSLNKKFKSEYEWLSTDREIVDMYINDPYCGQSFTSQAFLDLFSWISKSQKTNSIDKIQKNLPLLFISGANDSAGNFGKGVKKAYKLYVDSELTETDFKLFRNGRHELLNESFKEEVYQYINNWLTEIETK